MILKPLSACSGDCGEGLSFRIPRDNGVGPGAVVGHQQTPAAVGAVRGTRLFRAGRVHRGIPVLVRRHAASRPDAATGGRRLRVKAPPDILARKSCICSSPVIAGTQNCTREAITIMRLWRRPPVERRCKRARRPRSMQCAGRRSQLESQTLWRVIWTRPISRHSPLWQERQSAG